MSVVRGAGLFLLVTVVYLPAWNLTFIWDDDDYVLNNSTIQSWGGLQRIWLEPRATPQYYPLVHSTFWMEYHLWGLDPAGYHAVNVLLHALTCVLIWRVLVLLQVPGAWFAAAIFGVHPVHVESVAWITERKNVLSAACYLGALLVSLPLFGLSAQIPRKPQPIGRYLVATALFVGALLSKSVTCSLPATLLLLVYWKRGRITWEDARPLWPWFALGAFAAMHTAWLERTHVGASGTIFAWTLVERGWIAGHALWFYLEKLAWPAPLAFFYPRWNIDTGTASTWLAPAAAVLLPVVLYIARPRIGRGPLVAALFFGGTLIPALGFVNLYPMRYSFVADHFQYLASLGPIVLLTALATSGLARCRVSASGKRWIGLLTACTVLTPLSLLTWKQQAIYRNVESLWTDTLVKNPTSFAAHFYLGKIRTQQGRNAAAAGHFRKALELQTDRSESHIIWTLLGNSLARQGEQQAAEEAFAAALGFSPEYWEALHGLANVAARQNRHAEAVALYRRVLRQQPGAAVVHHNLANALAAAGDLTPAILEYQTALELQPDLVDAWVNLGNAYARQQRFLEAEQQYIAALRLQPGHQVARANLAKVRSSRARTPQLPH